MRVSWRRSVWMNRTSTYSQSDEEEEHGQLERPDEGRVDGPARDLYLAAYDPARRAKVSIPFRGAGRNIRGKRT